MFVASVVEKGTLYKIVIYVLCEKEINFKAHFSEEKWKIFI